MTGEQTEVQSRQVLQNRGGKCQQWVNINYPVLDGLHSPQKFSFTALEWSWAQHCSWKTMGLLLTLDHANNLKPNWIRDEIMPACTAWNKGERIMDGKWGMVIPVMELLREFWFIFNIYCLDFWCTVVLDCEVCSVLFFCTSFWEM